MLFIALSTTDNVRQRVNYETSLKKFIEMGHGAYFINKKGNFTYPTIEPHESFLHYQMVDGKFDPNRDRAIKRVSACKFFVENTTFDYLWITADDVFYDSNALDPMLNKLSTKYDTNKDIVFLGHSPKTTCEKDIYYLQGGTGSILSRRGAKKFLEVGETYIKESTIADDVQLDIVRKYMNLTVKDTATQYMFGHGEWVNKEIFAQNDWYRRVFPKCPSNDNLPKYCTCTGVYNLKELVAWHGKYSSSTSHKTMQLILLAKKNDNSIYYYFDNVAIHFCRR